MQRLSLAGALLPAVTLTMLAACQGDAPQPADTTGPTVETDAVANLAVAPFNLGRSCARARPRVQGTRVPPLRLLARQVGDRGFRLGSGCGWR